MGSLKAMPNRLGSMPARVKAAPKTAEQFYTSPEWRRTIAQIKRQRGAFCERCGSGHRVIGDHKVERKDGGAELDPDNVELLCARHHNEKTAMARAARASGRSASPPTT
jgi:5-methylcytosine-specific restriction endonuclease McrA